MLPIIRPLVKCLALVRSLEVSAAGGSLVVGEWLLSARRVVEPAPRPSLPPRTITTTGEAVEETPAPVAAGRPNLRVVRAA